jgi:hypothetical protein
MCGCASFCAAFSLLLSVGFAAGFLVCLLSALGAPLHGCPAGPLASARHGLEGRCVGGDACTMQVLANVWLAPPRVVFPRCPGARGSVGLTNRRPCPLPHWGVGLPPLKPPTNLHTASDPGSMHTAARRPTGAVSHRHTNSGSISAHNQVTVRSNTKIGCP